MKRQANRRPVAVAALVGVAAIAAGMVGATAQAADPADLAVTKADSADPVARGDNLNYTIVVRNLGPDPAENVVMTDRLPGGLRHLSTSTTAGTCAIQAREITCTLGTVAALAEVTVTIRTRVTKRRGTIDNTASVESTTADPVAANNSDTERTTVRPRTGGPTCQGVRATIVGTPGNDVIVGTARRDVILARAGHDRVFAGGGRDIVCAGPGADLVRGGPQGDSVTGGIGADLLIGNRGADRLRGNAGPDRLRGGAGADILRGNRGRDRLRGGFGPDLLVGGPGIDLCRGGPGADVLRSCER